MTKLFEATRIKSLTMPNRFVRSAIARYDKRVSRSLAEFETTNTELMW